MVRTPSALIVLIVLVALASGCRPSPSASQPGGDSSTPAEAQRLPAQNVKTNGIYTPDCDRERLAQLGLIGHFATKIKFCVEPDGKVSRIRTVSSSGNDVVDGVCRDTVKDWRFRPFMVEGTPTTTCTDIEFLIVFQP